METIIYLFIYIFGTQEVLDHMISFHQVDWSHFYKSACVYVGGWMVQRLVLMDFEGYISTCIYHEAP